VPLLRIEPVEDVTSGRYYIEIYYPAESAVPFATTAPRYQTAAAAENDTIAIIAAAANRDRPDHEASSKH
jgi:hypothetical protein